MRFCFIVCEFNPLHNGHLFLIDRAKELGCDAIVGIMSGNFVQRGECAVRDRYTRAQWAIRAGMDLVIELPVKYALSSAQFFANGALELTRWFEGERYLIFGTENCDEQAFVSISRILTEETEYFQRELRGALDRGLNYPNAVNAALEALQIDKKLFPIYSQPNNVLALEYYKAIRSRNLSLTPVPIPRAGNSYHDLSASGRYLSASAIREIYASKPLDKARDLCASYVPDYVLRDLRFEDYDDRLLALAKYLIASREDLTAIRGMGEGLGNRFLSDLPHARTLQDLFRAVKCKRYPLSGIKRAFLNALIGNQETNERLLKSSYNAINVLAVEKSRSFILSKITLPFFVSYAKYQAAFPDPIADRADRLYRAMFDCPQETFRIVERG